MSFISIARVNALPATLEANTLYLVKSASTGLMEMTVTGNTSSEVRHLINEAEIQTMINNSVANFSNIRLTADIATRDALVLDHNSIVLVADATGDATVNAGAALYFYDVAGNTYTKVSEYESLDVVLEWSAIQNKPTSSVADIDDAVARKHSHANIATLDLLTQDANGNLLVNGQYPGTYIATTEW
jgi:uncharacterized surface anchored protein